jgi:hypothetical protein
MARLEIELNGTKVTVENVAPHEVGLWVKGFTDAMAPKGPEPVADVSDPKQYREVRDVYYIESQSSPGKDHRVVHYGNGIFECPCPGFAHRGYCRHTTEALNKHRTRYYGYR